MRYHLELYRAKLAPFHEALARAGHVATLDPRSCGLSVHRVAPQGPRTRPDAAIYWLGDSYYLAVPGAAPWSRARVPSARRVVPACRLVLDGGLSSRDALWRHAIARYGLEPVTVGEYVTARRAARDARLACAGWQMMTNAESDLLYGRLERLLGHGSERPALGPFVTWDVSECTRVRGDAADALEDDLTLKALAAFRRATTPGERLHALTWQSVGWHFDPHAAVTLPYEEYWAVEVLPYLDPVNFVAPDDRFGLLGNWHRMTICVFGQELIDALARDAPRLFAHRTWDDAQEARRIATCTALGWRAIPIEQREEMMERVRQRLALDLGRPRGEPVIHAPEPAMRFSLAPVFGRDDAAAHAREALATALHQGLCCAARAGERLYAFDWARAYEQYDVDPRAIPSADASCWARPLLSECEYTTFASEDVRFGLFGDPRDRALYVFGRELLDAVATRCTALLGAPRRV